MNRYLALIGGVLIGLPFAMSGLGKLAAYGPTSAMIAAVGLPVPPLAFVVAVALELGGGFLLIADYQVRPELCWTEAQLRRLPADGRQGAGNPSWRRSS
jgi:uncharacterized membrane protein YphA (DoxX/SURF4 family)